DMQRLTDDGKMTDFSGQCHHGSITGTTDVACLPGRRSSDLSDKIASFVPVAGLTQWTIALWVSWHDGPNAYEHPIGLGVGHDATFWISGTTVAFTTQDASGNTVVDKSLSSSITTGVWYHLAA